ncbi:MAG: hypothetical protein MRY64_06350 [Hyphomonadaceae bacterium]|nr:hypothetical protein [Hyphomonadaceae bacterium]
MLDRPETPFHRPAQDPQSRARHWSPFLVKRHLIEDQIGALSDARMEDGEIRARSIVHPMCQDAIESLTPATEVTLNVLLPGETRTVVRDNANRIELCLQGEGRVSAGRDLEVNRHDVWTIPPMQPFTYEVQGSKPLVWLSYANTALLRRLGAYVKETGPFTLKEETKGVLTDEKKSAYSRHGAPDILMPDGIARLRGYEHLTDIEEIDSRAMHWAWRDIEPRLPLAPGEMAGTDKRNIWLLYNPATGRRQGTTGTYFATYGGCGPDIPAYAGDRGHRHTSASINYHTRGSGSSIVDGERICWEEGDLLYSAPAWLEHAHYHGPNGWTVLTVQDHPMHIAMGSLLWQEDMTGPIYSLGAGEGQKGYVSPREVGA